MGIARFTEQAFVGEQGNANTIRNGEIGNVYGIPVFVTSNADTTSGSTATRICLLAHKDFAVLVEQMGVRTQTQYKQEYLGTLFTADVLYGVRRTARWRCCCSSCSGLSNLRGWPFGAGLFHTVRVTL